MHKADTAAGVTAKSQPATTLSSMDLHAITHGDNCQDYYCVDAVRHLRALIMQQEFSTAGYRLALACDLILDRMIDDNEGCCGR